MRRLAALLLLGLAACGGYSNNDLELVVAYASKETCSCLWVMQRDEAYCRAWTKASPQVAELDIDWDARQVTAHALLLFSSRARFVSEREGCVLAGE
jgi:hypothetical protein